jgi:membrane fusion protein, multidrug efflux system
MRSNLFGSPVLGSPVLGSLVLGSLVLGLLPLGVVGCGGPEQPTERGLERVELPRVRVLPVAKQEMVQRLTTTTVVRSQRQVQVLPQANGVVLELLAEEGDAVEEGAVLARLDARDVHAGVREAQVALREAENGVTQARIALREAEAAVVTMRLAADQARRNFERNEKTGLISEQDLDALRLARGTAERDSVAAGLAVERREHDLHAAETSVERSQVLLERAELALSHTDVRAPFTGRIAQRLVSAGDSVGATSALFVLVDPHDLVAVLHRPQRELAMFLGHWQPGNGSAATLEGAAPSAMEILATAEALPGRTFRGELLRLSPSIDPESGSFRVTVRLHPDASGVQLLPGMLVRLGLITERRPDALVVPKKAVQREGDALVLWRVEEGRARRVPVEEGFASDYDLEVRPLRGARLAEGDTIVVIGNRDLEDGDEIEVVVEPALGVLPVVEEAPAPPRDAAPTSEQGA